MILALSLFFAVQPPRTASIAESDRSPHISAAIAENAATTIVLFETPVKAELVLNGVRQDVSVRKNFVHVTDRKAPLGAKGTLNVAMADGRTIAFDLIMAKYEHADSIINVVVVGFGPEMNMVLLLALLTAADVKPARTYRVDDSTRAKTLEVQVASGVVTSIHFPTQVLVDDVVCGNPSAFVIKPTLSNTQLNFGPQPTVAKNFATNCNVPLASGLTITMNLSVSGSPDSFVDVVVDLKSPPPPAIKPKVDDAAVEERIFKVEAECRGEAEQQLVEKAAQAIVMRHIDKRGIHDNIILAVLDHVKLGSRGIIRFSVENHSRVPWAAGDVRISFYVSGRDAKVVETKAGFTKPIANTADEIFGAVTFEMIDLPLDAKFSLEVAERNGSRHPKVEGFRL